MPRVSVLMTSYNPGAFLRPAVESILAQTFRDFELVLVNDGSRDGSPDVCRALAAQNSRVRFFDLEKNIGRTPALNYGFRQCAGDYIAVLDADDLSAPERLARQVAILDSGNAVSCVATHATVIDQNDRELYRIEPPLSHSELYALMAVDNPIMHSSAMYRRSDLAVLGGYSERYKYAQDFWLWLQLAQRGRFAMIPERLTSIREHGSRLTRNPNMTATRYAELFELYGIGAALPGQDAETLRRHRANASKLHFMFGGEMLRVGRFSKAVAELLRSLAVDPAFFVQKFFTELRLVVRKAAGRLS